MGRRRRPAGHATSPRTNQKVRGALSPPGTQAFRTEQAVARNEVNTVDELREELGQIESWSIFRSDLPNSGDFNLLLIVKFANTADLAPNKARYDAFMKKFGEERNNETTEYAHKNYPAMRELTGQYLLREITLK